MLAIGRTLMGSPRLLMVDEPTEGLSPIMVEEVREILQEVGKAGISILLVEHNFKMATSLADRVFVMGKAHIGYAGITQSLLDDPKIIEQYLEV
jgi:branched-chain amino acid transport system ATP-binding protein